VERVVHLALDEAEVEALKESASVLHGVLEELDLPRERRP
jgi:hypothetical protein